MNKLKFMLLNNQGLTIKDATIWQVKNCDYLSYYVYVKAPDTITVNWGDGNIQEIYVGGEYQIGHYYYNFPEGQDYFQIQITGNHTLVRFYTSECEKYVTKLISGAKTLMDYDQMCYRCSNLKSIDNTFFIYDNVEEFEQINCNMMFRQSGIEKIEHNLFEFIGNNRQCECRSMFQYCNSLLSVTGLSLPTKSSTAWMFGECYNLINVNAQNLVSKWTAGYTADHSYMFYDCYSMTGVFNQNYWWAQFDGGPVNWSSFYNTGIFYNCNSLPNYDYIPSDWK